MSISTPPASLVTQISVPATVTANKPTTATIYAGVIGYNTSYHSAAALNLYLGGTASPFKDTYELWGQCTLVKHIALCDIPNVVIKDDSVAFFNSTVEFTVPSSVGPSAFAYNIVAQVIQEEGQLYSKVSRNGMDYQAEFYSDVFELVDATGEWSENAGRGLAEAYECPAVSCARKCQDARYTNVEDRLTGEGYRKCLENCGDGIDMGWILDELQYPEDWKAPTVSLQPATCSPTGALAGSVLPQELVYGTKAADGQMSASRTDSPVPTQSPATSGSLSGAGTATTGTGTSLSSPASTSLAANVGMRLGTQAASKIGFVFGILLASLVL